jgi:hypothetical protein
MSSCRCSWMNVSGILSYWRTFGSCQKTVAVSCFVLTNRDTTSEPEQTNIKLFLWKFSDMEWDRSWISESPGSRCFKWNETPFPVISLCVQLSLFMLPEEGTFQLSQMALSLQCQIKLLVCSVPYVCALWFCNVICILSLLTHLLTYFMKQ